MNQRVLVIGSSLAGLVAAFRLSLNGYTVTILELPDHEEASWFPLNDDAKYLKTPWNQHGGWDPISSFVLYGPSQYTMALLEELGKQPHVRQFASVPIEFVTSNRQRTSFAPWPLPSPWHTLAELIRFPALSLRQKWHMLNYIEKIWEGAATLPTQLDLQTANSWLTAIGQPQLAQERVWEPLCRFLLGAPLSQTYATTLATTLKQVFLQSRRQYPSIPSTLGIEQLLLKPLRTWLRARGVDFVQIHALELNQVTTEQITGLRTHDGTALTADWYVMALHPNTFTTLLPERLLARYAFFHQLNQVQQAPALQLDFCIPQSISKPRLILQKGKFSWTLCRPIDTSDGIKTLVSCVSTGDRDLQSQTNETLKSIAKNELKVILSIMDKDEACDQGTYRISRHRQEFVPQGANTKSFRPSNHTPLSNLFLTGDWTDTESLTNVESSTMSGTLCAEAIHERGNSATSRH